MKLQDLITDKTSLWIFGYGSLVWKPDFKYQRSKVGYIRGYMRRFWQGDNFHRGTDESPGRVVTLIEGNDETTWGVAFEVSGSQVEESLKYLNIRETVCGGYITKIVDFYPEGEDSSPVPALVYIATSDNPLYLGPASPEEIGAQIAVCRGKTGHNLEYLLRLADFMRKHCPHVEDHHLYSIEEAAVTVTVTVVFHSSGEQPQEGSPDFPYLGHILQLFRADPKTFPGQLGDLVSPAGPGSASGFLGGGTCPEHLSQEVSGRHPHH